MKSIKQSLPRRTITLMVIASVLIFAACRKDIQQPITQEEATVSPNSSPQAEQQSGLNYEPNQVLVKFSKGISESKRAAALARIGGNVAEKILTRTMKRFGDNEGVYLINTPMAALEAISRVKGIEIEYAEPNYIYTHSDVSNDPYFTNGSLWGTNGTYGSNAVTAWGNGHTGSSTVYVGVIDEGVQYTHPDLVANFWTNPFDQAGDGIDNDGNGYKDDTHGWDFAGNNNTTYDGTGDDHGTHVSGTIGAKGGNGTGVAGVNWNVTIISAKFLGSNGGTTANAIKAVDYITDLKTLHNLNIVATNNSWGGGGYSSGLQAAIERANAANILFVAAAGNGNPGGKAINIDSKPSYPASYSNANVIAVAAINSTGGIASWSNYGATSVDLGAPGVGIYSTLPNNTYGSYSGTSMATPHVTGACALYASTHPGSSAAVIKNAILSNTIFTSSLNGKCATNGRLNVSGF
jgi:subtilisin family serine protease